MQHKSKPSLLGPSEGAYAHLRVFSSPDPHPGFPPETVNERKELVPSKQVRLVRTHRSHNLFKPQQEEKPNLYVFAIPTAPSTKRYKTEVIKAKVIKTEATGDNQSHDTDTLSNVLDTSPKRRKILETGDNHPSSKTNISPDANKIAFAKIFDIRAIEKQAEANRLALIELVNARAMEKQVEADRLALEHSIAELSSTFAVYPPEAARIIPKPEVENSILGTLKYKAPQEHQGNIGL